MAVIAKLTKMLRCTVSISLCIVSSYRFSFILRANLHRQRDSYSPIDGSTNLGKMILSSYLTVMRMIDWSLLVSAVFGRDIRPVSILLWSILISRVCVSIRNPQNGKPDVSSWGVEDILLPDKTCAEARLWSRKERRVLLGDTKAPYSGNPDFMTWTNRLAAIKSSVMNRKSSMYLNNRYYQLCTRKRTYRSWSMYES